MRPEPNRSELIQAADLAPLLGQVVVLDATLFLPHEGRVAYAEHLAARIPGARFFAIDVFADPDSRLPHMVPAAGRFARLAGELGIGDGATVVAYDQRGLFSAGRAWWLMRLFGVAAMVLDGGLPAWRAAGLPVESGAPEPLAAAMLTPSLHARLWRGVGDVRANIGSGAELLVDARAAPRFAGSVPEARPGVRAGHVPGAANLPFTELLEDGRLLRPDALRARLAAAGIDGTRPVVTMCGSGVTATVVNLAMAVAGLPEGAMYDGSWTEWGGRPDLPIA